MSSRLARQHARTAAEIADAGHALVLQGGLSALTIQAVAQAVELTPGALYRYYPSRDAIVAAVQARVVADLALAITTAITLEFDVAFAPLHRIVAAVHAAVAFATREPGSYALISQLLAEPTVIVEDSSAASVVPVVMTAVAPVQDALAQARIAGLLHEGDDVQRLMALWAVAHGAIQLHKLRRFSPQAHVTDVSCTALTALLIGFGAPMDAVTRIVENTFIGDATP